MKFRREDSNKFDLVFDAVSQDTGMDIAKGLSASDFIGAIVKVAASDGTIGLTAYYTIVSATEMASGNNTAVVAYAVNVTAATKAIKVVVVGYIPSTGHVSIEVTT